MTLFINIFPLEILFRIWDIILFEGFDFVYSVAISILKILEGNY
jgi:hypothetical protein